MAKRKAEDLFDESRAVIKTYSARDELFDALEKYYFLDYADEDEPEEGIEVVHLPHGTNAVDLVQDLLGAAEVTITVPALGEKQSAKTLADTAEKYLRTLLHQSARAQHQDLFGRAAWLVAMRGMVAGRVLFVDSWLEQVESEEGQTEFRAGNKIPLLFQLRDPRWVYPAFGLDGLDYVVEKQRRTVRDLRRTYPGILTESDPDTEVEWIEYWDSESYCYWAAGEPVKKGKGRGRAGPWAHGYGGIPYAVEFARQTGKLTPEKRVRPLLEAMRSSIERADILDSMEHTFIGDYLGTAWKLITEPDSELKPADVDLRPGAINPLRQGEDIVPLQGGRAPLELDKARAKLMVALERASFPGTMYGEDPGRVLAGYAINLLNESGRVRLNPLAEAIEDLMARLCENALMVSEHKISPLLDGNAIPFLWVEDAEDEASGGEYRRRTEFKLDAAGFQGMYLVEIGMGDLLPQDEQGNVVLADRLRAPGAHGQPLLSDESILERYRLADDVAAERARLELQAARQSPEIQALMQAVRIAEIKRDLLDLLTELDVDVDEVLASIAQAGPPNVQQQQLGLPPGLPPEVMPAAMQGQIPPAVMPQEPAMMPMAPMGPPPAPIY